MHFFRTRTNRALTFGAKFSAAKKVKRKAGLPKGKKSPRHLWRLLVRSDRWLSALGPSPRAAVRESASWRSRWRCGCGAGSTSAATSPPPPRRPRRSGPRRRPPPPPPGCGHRLLYVSDCLDDKFMVSHRSIHRESDQHGGASRAFRSCSESMLEVNPSRRPVPSANLVYLRDVTN